MGASVLVVELALVVGAAPVVGGAAGLVDEGVAVDDVVVDVATVVVVGATEVLVDEVVLPTGVAAGAGSVPMTTETTIESSVIKQAAPV